MQGTEYRVRGDSDSHNGVLWERQSAPTILEFIRRKIMPESPTIISEENIPFLDSLIIEEYLYEKIEHKQANNSRSWHSKVARPSELMIDLQESASLPVSSPILRYNLIPRAVVGHATEGHVMFSENHGFGKRVNTSLEDIISDEVLRALTKEDGSSAYSGREEFLTETQELINSIANLLTRSVNTYDKTIRATDEEGKPILGLGFLKNVDLNPQALLTGYYFGAHFDDYKDIRKEAERLHGLNYGGGETYLVDRELAAGLGIDLKEFTSGDYTDEVLKVQPFEKRMNIFKNIGLVKDMSGIDFAKTKNWEEVLEQGENMIDNNLHIQQYIREKKGKGGSDDVLIRLASFLKYNGNYKSKNSAWYNGLQVGAQLADFVDTLEKATAIYIPHGMDNGLAKFIEQKWLDKARNDPTYRKVHNIKPGQLEKEEYALVDKKELVTLTALGINPRTQIHSSARYFLKRQEIPGLTATDTAEYTTTIEQEFLYMQKKLEDLGCNMNNIHGKPSLEGELYENSGILIGFNRQPFKYFMTHFENNVLPFALRKTVPKKQI